MAGRVCVRKEELFLRSCHHGLQSVNIPKHASDKEEEHSHKRARLGGKEYGGLPVVGLMRARIGVGRPPILGLVTLRGCQFVSPLRE